MGTKIAFTNPSPLSLSSFCLFSLPRSFISLLTLSPPLPPLAIPEPFSKTFECLLRVSHPIAIDDLNPSPTPPPPYNDDDDDDEDGEVVRSSYRSSPQRRRGSHIGADTREGERQRWRVQHYCVFDLIECLPSPKESSLTILNISSLDWWQVAQVRHGYWYPIASCPSYLNHNFWNMRRRSGGYFVGWSGADDRLQSTKDNAIDDGNKQQLIDNSSNCGMENQIVELIEEPVEAAACLLRLKALLIMSSSSDITINHSEASLVKPEPNAPL
uniref:Uncharacterized protein n=1 Tax=Ananas comosus var. bracteatus TaxID=296719 RepID=A0A6V7QRG2_ANACO